MGRRRTLIFNYTTGFTPPTANLTVHYDASISASVHIVTGVSQWDDQSGNSNNLLQAITGKQPVYSGTGTSSIITFDGASQFLTATFTLNQPETVYLVMKQITWTNNGVFLDGGSVNHMWIQQYPSTPTVYLYAGGSDFTGTSAFTLNTMKVVTAIFNGASSFISINDAGGHTNNAGNLNAGGLTLGANFNGGSGLFGNVAIQEVYVYSAAHSSSTQTSMVTYLRAKWGI